MVKYEATVEKVRMLVSNKVAMAEGLAPMDIRGLDNNAEEEYYDVDAVRPGKHGVTCAMGLGTCSGCVP